MPGWYRADQDLATRENVTLGSWLITSASSLSIAEVVAFFYASPQLTANARAECHRSRRVCLSHEHAAG